MAKKIQSVNTKNAIEKRKEFLARSLEDLESCTVHLSLGNSKTGPIPSFSVLPLLSCTNCGECSKKCYACKGNFNFNRNINGLAENTALLMEKPYEVEKAINEFLNCKTIIYKFFRWNVAGDIAGVVLDQYFPLIVRIAEKNPLTTFLMFTKNYKLINDYISSGHFLPQNLNIVFSRWHNTPIENPYGLPVAIVKIDETTEIPVGAFHCDGDCSNCLKCWRIEQEEAVYFDLH